MGNKIITYKYKDGDGNLGYHFHCPGCGENHGVCTEGEGVPIWEFNGNEEFPTFRPSIKVTFDHLSEEAMQQNIDFYKVHGRYLTHKELPYDVREICHSWVTNGNIEFLSDCTHHLKGQTVELNDF